MKSLTYLYKHLISLYEVYLNRYVAIFFSLITVFSILSQANSFCSSASVKKSSGTSSTLEKQEENLSPEYLNDGDSSETSCDSGNLSCHNCHLGHCSFPISSIFQVGILLFATPLDSKVAFFVIFDFHTNLFRPPIA